MDLKHPIKIELLLRDILYEDEIVAHNKPIKCTFEGFKVTESMITGSTKYNGVVLND